MEFLSFTSHTLKLIRGKLKKFMLQCPTYKYIFPLVLIFGVTAHQPSFTFNFHRYSLGIRRPDRIDAIWQTNQWWNIRIRLTAILFILASGAVFVKVASPGLWNALALLATLELLRRTLFGIPAWKTEKTYTFLNTTVYYTTRLVWHLIIQSPCLILPWLESFFVSHTRAYKFTKALYKASFYNDIVLLFYTRQKLFLWYEIL